MIQTKSHLDWQDYKKREGIEAELEQHRKNGFLDKQDFIKDSAWKEYELELQQRSSSKSA